MLLNRDKRNYFEKMVSPANSTITSKVKFIVEGMILLIRLIQHHMEGPNLLNWLFTPKKNSGGLMNKVESFPVPAIGCTFLQQRSQNYFLNCYETIVFTKKCGDAIVSFFKRENPTLAYNRRFHPCTCFLVFSNSYIRYQPMSRPNPKKLRFPR